jgi:hypothetical protein
MFFAITEPDAGSAPTTSSSAQAHIVDWAWPTLGAA